MSVTASIDLCGSFIDSDRFRSITEFLKKKGAKTSFDGIIRANRQVDSGWEYVELMHHGKDAFDFIYNKLKSGEIIAFYALFSINCIDQYILFSSEDADSLLILIEGNRTTIDGYHTDFSWYFTHLISKIRNNLFITHSIRYEDSY